MDSNNTSFQAQEPKLCANGCGFYGSPSTLNFCSKCFRIEQLNITLEKVSKKETTLDPPVVVVSPTIVVQDKCQTCKKRIRLARGYKCRCGYIFCESHRYPEEHRCTFDYMALGKYEIAKANPSLKADKLERI